MRVLISVACFVFSASPHAKSDDFPTFVPKFDDDISFDEEQKMEIIQEPDSNEHLVDVKFSQEKQFCSYCPIKTESKEILMSHILEVHGNESRQSSLELKNEPGTSSIKSEPLDEDFSTPPDSFREFSIIYSYYEQST